MFRVWMKEAQKSINAYVDFCDFSQQLYKNNDDKAEMYYDIAMEYLYYNRECLANSIGFASK